MRVFPKNAPEVQAECKALVAWAKLRGPVDGRLICSCSSLDSLAKRKNLAPLFRCLDICAPPPGKPKEKLAEHFRVQNFFPVIFRLENAMPQLLLDLPTDVLRLILSYIVRYPLSLITARFVCRRFRDLLPPLSKETRQQARYFCGLAASNGYLNLIKWARTNGCPWSEYTSARAARGGHLEVLQWLRANGCPWTATICSNAAAGGHLEVLQWARTNGCPWNEWTCCGAAQGGHLVMLQWARTNGCPWNERTCHSAAERGHLEVLQWATSTVAHTIEFICGACHT